MFVHLLYIVITQTEEYRESDEQAEYPGLIADVMRDNEIRRSISNFEEVIASVSLHI